MGKKEEMVIFGKHACHETHLPHADLSIYMISAMFVREFLEKTDIFPKTKKNDVRSSPKPEMSH